LLRFMAFFLCRYEDIYTNLETKQGRQVLLGFTNSLFRVNAVRRLICIFHHRATVPINYAKHSRVFSSFSSFYNIEGTCAVASFYPHLYQASLSMLVDAREKTALTQTQLAERFGQPEELVASYEEGDRLLDPAEFISVCRAIGGRGPVRAAEKGRSRKRARLQLTGATIRTSRSQLPTQHRAAALSAAWGAARRTLATFCRDERKLQLQRLTRRRQKY
jgi:hypothetical protein